MPRPLPYRRAAICLLVLIGLCSLPMATVAGQSPAAVGSLLAIAQEAAELRRPSRTDGLPDFRPATLAQRRDRLHEARRALAALPHTADRATLIDRLLVWAQLNAVDFELRVVRPWARDPGGAVDAIRRTPYADVPDDAEATSALRDRLRAVGPTLARHRAALTEPAAELARMAIRQLERSDGVNQGEPRRAVPPAGVIGWYDDLVARLEAADSPLAETARVARGHVTAFRDELVAAVPTMDEPAWIGLGEYDWYLRNVLLLPHDSAELRVIADRELARARTFLAIERHRNRGLPPIVPARTAEEHAARVEEAEGLIRSFVAANELLTVPSDLPPRFETDAFWIVRPGGKRHFWEEITYRDPLNNHIHASIPGHRFDGLVGRRETRPVRAGYRDGVRAEGWAFYIEEMFLQAGLLDDRPRSRELFYIAQLKRAARVPADLAMQSGGMDLQDAIDYLVEQVPLMEPDLARYDLAIYLRRPTYGMNYVMGKVLLEQLLSDRALQEGDAFDLGAFHDRFLAAGPIPIPLIRWEMTGLDDQVAPFLPAVGGSR